MMQPRKIRNDLYLIPLKQKKLTGFSEFISTWLYKGEMAAFIADPGPKSTIPDLIRALESLGVEKLDAILVTHIHIDHSGGLGDLLERYPDTPVVCHPSAPKHLTDPTRLWEGSLKTLGKTAEAYGPISPIPASVIHTSDTPFRPNGGGEIIPIETPGHAPHHVSYLYGAYLFAGEAGGVYRDLGEGNFYLRPATPPRFFMETSLESIDRLIETPHELYLFGHFGCTEKTPELLRAHKDQLHRWAKIIEAELEKGQSPDYTDRCIDALLAKDPLMGVWDRLSPEIRTRERGFLKNSVAGFTGYLTSRK